MFLLRLFLVGATATSDLTACKDSRACVWFLFSVRSVFFFFLFSIPVHGQAGKQATITARRSRAVSTVSTAGGVGGRQVVVGGGIVIRVAVGKAGGGWGGGSKKGGAG